MSYEEQEMMMNEEESINLSPVQRVFNIFVSPGKVFKSIDNKPNFILPIIIVIVLSLGIYLAFFNQYYEVILKTMETALENSPTQMTGDFIEKTAKISAISTVASLPFTTVIGMLLSALFYWVYGIILKGEGNYKKYFSLMANVSLITLLSVVLTGILALFTGEFKADLPITSLASLLPAGLKNTALYGMALNIEVFSIWRLVLVYLGIKEIGKLSSKKAFIMVATAFILVMIFTGGSMLLSGLANQSM